MLLYLADAKLKASRKRQMASAEFSALWKLFVALILILDLALALPKHTCPRYIIPKSESVLFPLFSCTAKKKIPI